MDFSIFKKSLLTIIKFTFNLSNAYLGLTVKINRTM